MEEKIEEMEFKRGSVNFYGGPNEGANTHSQRGIYNIHVGKTSTREKPQRRAEAGFLTVNAHADKVTDCLSKTMACQ